jgi:hypothetical protein
VKPFEKIFKPLNLCGRKPRRVQPGTENGRNGYPFLPWFCQPWLVGWLLAARGAIPWWLVAVRKDSVHDARAGHGPVTLTDAAIIIAQPSKEIKSPKAEGSVGVNGSKA